MGLTTGEVAEMRAAATQSFNDIAIIRRYVETEDVYGTTTRVWTEINAVPCRLGPSTYLPTELSQADRTLVKARWVITLPADTDVEAADEIEISGRVFQIINVFERGNMEIVRRIQAETRD